MSSKQHYGLRKLIDGILIGISGTNKEKTKEGIKMIISCILCLFFVWCGLMLLGYHPTIAGDVADVLTGLMSKVGSIAVAIFIFIVIGIPGIAFLLSLIILTIGSLVSLIKHNDSEGSPLAAYLVNQIGLIVVIGLGIMLFI